MGETGSKQMQQRLGEQRFLMQSRITHYFSRRFVESRFGLVEGGDEAVQKILEKVDPDDRVVNRALFETWVTRPDLTEMLEECQIDSSGKFFLFDSLDFECRGELDIGTIIAGIMILRGPITKLDIVSSRLKIM